MNEKMEGADRQFLSAEIMDKLDRLHSLSLCVRELSRATLSFFLGEPDAMPKKDLSSIRVSDGEAGYFYQVKNGLGDAYGFLEEALGNLVGLGREIGIDRSKISESPEPSRKG